MGRGLFTLGSLLLVLTVGLWIAEAAGWVTRGSIDRVSSFAWKAGLGLLAAGALLRLLTPIRRRLSTGRCVTCGRAVLPGHLYCTVHLQHSVNAWRDQTRNRSHGRSRGRR